MTHRRTLPDRPRRGRPVTIAPHTVSRRTVLEWFGRSAVLALGADLVAACEASGASGEDARSALDALLDADRRARDAASPVDVRGVADAATPPPPDAARDTAAPLDAATPPDAATPLDTATAPDAAPDAAPDTGVDTAPDIAPDAGAPPDADAPSFPFAPGDEDDELFRTWWERTVDRQDLEAILAGWELRVDGMVEEPLTLSFADLVALPRQDQVTDFHCVEGWSVYDVPWSGVHLSQLFQRARPLAGATHVTFHTVDGTYNESLPLPIALEPKTMLGYGVGGDTLPLAHGFPLRVVVPRLLGYKNAKYVERIELTDRPVEGFWVNVGYPYDGEVPEARLREGKY